MKRQGIKMHLDFSTLSYPDGIRITNGDSREYITAEEARRKFAEFVKIVENELRRREASSGGGEPTVAIEGVTS